MDKIDMVLTDAESGDYTDYGCAFVRIRNVKMCDMYSIIEYAFNSGYNVVLERPME